MGTLLSFELVKMTGYKHRLFKRLEVYYSDLNEQAQKDILKFHGIKDPEEMNLGFTPIFEIVKIEQS